MSVTKTLLETMQDEVCTTTTLFLAQKKHKRCIYFVPEGVEARVHKVKQRLRFHVNVGFNFPVNFEISTFQEQDFLAER
jgi:hypothetical protein